MYICLYLSICTYIHVHIEICLYRYIDIYIYIYIYIYMHKFHQVVPKLSAEALKTNKDLPADTIGYRWVSIKGTDDSVAAADALVRQVYILFETF
jgi:hypothetical protein